jgi:hypothetical protein
MYPVVETHPFPPEQAFFFPLFHGMGLARVNLYTWARIHIFLCPEDIDPRNIGQREAMGQGNSIHPGNRE